MSDKKKNGSTTPMVRFGLVVADWCEKWFPDALVFAILAVFIPRSGRRILGRTRVIRSLGGREMADRGALYHGSRKHASDSSGMGRSDLQCSRGIAQSDQSLLDASPSWIAEDEGERDGRVFCRTVHVPYPRRSLSMLAVLQDLYLCAAYFPIRGMQEVCAVWRVDVLKERKPKKMHVVFSI